MGKFLRQVKKVIRAPDKYAQLALGVFFLCVAISVVVEVMLFYHLYRGDWPLSFILACHGGVVLLLGVPSLVGHVRRGYVKMPLLTLVFIAVTGPFGAIIGLGTVIFYFIFKRFSMPFADWLISLFPADDRTVEEDIYERLMFNWEDVSEKTNILPFQEIIAYGDVDQKRIALGKIARYFHPNFAPALRMALRDADNAVRVQAATIISQLEANFGDTCQFLEEGVAKHPDNLELRLKLAQSLVAYGSSGILGPDRQKDIYIRAVEAYHKYLAEKPKDLKAQFELAQILVKHHRIRLAHNIFKEYFLKDPKKMPVDQARFYMEILYHEKDYESLHNFAKRYEVHDLSYKPYEAVMLSDALNLWRQGHAG